MESCCPDSGSHISSSTCCTDHKPIHLKKYGSHVLTDTTQVCCGPRTAHTHIAHVMPGFRLCGFVKDFMETQAGAVPRVRTQLTYADRLGSVLARLGIGRDRYCIAPGLYGVGQPEATSPLFVTANYKLSFDNLRCSLAGINAWIVVLDTRSINVWCAAGKGTFSTQEVVHRLNTCQIKKIVTHRRLILPQLSATGVSARQVKKECGFKVIWGPVRARDIQDFFDRGMKATSAMREVTFSLGERVVLIPVELNHMGKPTLYVLPALFLLSGLGQGVFSLSASLSRGAVALSAYLLAVMAGAVVAPALLPWLPGRAFSLKGAGIGVAAGALLSVGFAGRLARTEMLALTLFIMAVSSYLTMNFTGSTPFTSPTGVEKEMRRAIPVQVIGALAAVMLWVGAGFMH